MRSAATFIIFAFLFSFALSISAQVQMPKIVWKNLQENYKSFREVRPTIVNESNQAVYFDCTLNYFEKVKMHSYVNQSDNTRLLFFDVEKNRWDWNVRVGGTVANEERHELKKRAQEIKNLQKIGEYVPRGCKVNSKEEFSINFDNSQWSTLVAGDGIGPTYKSGKYKFEIRYWWFNSRKDSGSNTIESPEFWIVPGEHY